MAVRDEDDHWRWTAPGAAAIVSSREGGASRAPWGTCNVGLHVGDDPRRVAGNRVRVAALLELDPTRVAGVTQVHGADVWLDLAHGETLSVDVRWSEDSSPIEADALVTTRQHVALAVGVADCMPIALAWGDAIAAIHAGWRSLEAGVIEATLAVLRRAAGPAIAVAGVAPHAFIGPSICARCMEVGEQVAARFDQTVVRRPPGATRPLLDTRADAARRLEAAGCIVEHVEVCTVEDPRCFSHRGDGGVTGRQTLLVRRV